MVMEAETAREQHADLLRHIAEISSILDQLENTVRLFAERHGNLTLAVDCAKAFQSAVADLKSEMLQQYLEYRITTAIPRTSENGYRLRT